MRLGTYPNFKKFVVLAAQGWYETVVHLLYWMCMQWVMILVTTVTVLVNNLKFPEYWLAKWLFGETQIPVKKKMLWQEYNGWKVAGSNPGASEVFFSQNRHLSVLDWKICRGLCHTIQVSFNFLKMFQMYNWHIDWRLRKIEFFERFESTGE